MKKDAKRQRTRNAVLDGRYPWYVMKEANDYEKRAVYHILGFSLMFFVVDVSHFDVK